MRLTLKSILLVWLCVENQIRPAFQNLLVDGGRGNHLCRLTARTGFCLDADECSRQTVAIRYLIIRRHNLDGGGKLSECDLYVNQFRPRLGAERRANRRSVELRGFIRQREGIGGGRWQRGCRRNLYLNQFRPHLDPDRRSQSKLVVRRFIIRWNQIGGGRRQ